MRTSVQADDVPGGIRRQTIRGVFLLIVFVLVTSGAPTLHWSQNALRERLDLYVDAVGLWQGQWELFAPEPDKINVAVVGIVEFADGETSEWRHPDWGELGPLGKFRSFRLMEFTDGIRRDANSGAWRTFAEYVVRTHPHPTNAYVPPTRVSLWRHYVVIPQPHEPLRPIADPFILSERELFFTARLEYSPNLGR